MKIWISLLLAITFVSCQPSGPSLPQNLQQNHQEGIFAQITTNKGNIFLNLEYQRTPLTVANFIGLAEGTFKNTLRESGPYYDGLTFHRVINDFMIQGGCPLGNGSGDPGYKFRDEFHPDLKHRGPGILSMANSGPGTNGSQFFITHKATPWLDGKHTVFGNVIQGQDVVNNIEIGDTIRFVSIIRKGEQAQQFDAAQIFQTNFNWFMGQVTKRSLLKHLEQLAPDELTAELVTLYQKIPAVRAYYQSELSDSEAALLLPYKKLIDKAYFPEKGPGKRKNANCLKVLRDFKRVVVFEYDYITLLLYRVSTGVAWARQADKTERKHYSAMLLSYQEAWSLAHQNNLVTEFKEQFFAILADASELPFDFAKDLERILDGDQEATSN